MIIWGIVGNEVGKGILEWEGVIYYCKVIFVFYFFVIWFFGFFEKMFLKVIVGLSCVFVELVFVN